jgi:hypothetical protein
MRSSLSLETPQMTVRPIADPALVFFREVVGRRGQRDKARPASEDRGNRVGYGDVEVLQINQAGVMRAGWPFACRPMLFSGVRAPTASISAGFVQRTVT